MSNDVHITLIWIVVSFNFLLDVLQDRDLRRRIENLERMIRLNPRTECGKWMRPPASGAAGVRCNLKPGHIGPCLSLPRWD